MQALAKPISLIFEDDSVITMMYPTTQYIWGSDRVLAKLEVTTGKSYYYLYNGHGDVVQIVDTSGNIVNSYDYDVWGNFISKQETISNHFTYFGQTYDETTGLYYLRARCYDPTTGRFTQQDPVEDGYNWYIYGNQNPVMLVDPTGYITQEEMDMYENGQMAPMAYSHLMNLTYNWYLADTDYSKAIYKQMADDFRETGYTTTNGAFPAVDEGIEYMPSRPTDTITKEQHFFRNELNLQFSWSTFKKLNERLPDNLKWRELSLGKSLLHKFGQGHNRKYVSACEHFEAVYTKENYLVNENFSAMNMGTYNYYGPGNASKHFDMDMTPYFAWGNTLSD